MNRFPALPPPQRLLRLLTATLAAVALPSLALAQAAAAPQPAAPAATGDDGPATIRAEQMTGRPDREVHLERNVEITRGPMTVTADRATYHIVEDQVDASGDVTMCRMGDRYTGDELQLRLDSGIGFLLHPTYRLARIHAEGAADRIDFHARDRATVHAGS